MKNEKPINVENWSTEEWESYLSKLEAPQREDLLADPTSIENLNSDYYLENFSNLIGQNYTPNLRDLCASIMEKLTPHQQQIITEIYWNDKSAQELSKEMGLSRTAIRKAKERAELQMKKYILNLQENQNRKNSENNQEAS